jgi:aryl-alcohol dehydrogenase-like predicted oxidoreductase
MKIALGTVQFGIDYGIANTGGQVSFTEVEKILKYANSQNIDLLDTASAYGNSEQVLGRSQIQNFKIITKTNHFKHDISTEKKSDLLARDLRQSLYFLKKKYVYGLLVHNSNDLLKIGADKIFNKLQELKQQGLITKIGVSIYDHQQLQQILDNFDIDLVQLPFNILDRRLIDSGMLRLLKEKNIEVHARSIFLQGLLLMSEQNRPRKFSRWDELWSLWHQWLNDNKITALEATTRYAISVPEISKVLVGVDTQEQLQEIIESSEGALPVLPKELFTNDVNLLNPSNWKI